MSEKSLIYVAGNPDAYPIEYFDADAHEYRGVIPELLREFSEESQYDIVYYQADGTDRRAELALNSQVDLVSGSTEEGLAEGLDSISVLGARSDGQEYDYRLYFTDSAPTVFKAQLNMYLSSVAPEEITGMLIDSANAPQSSGALMWTAGGLGLLVLALAVALALCARHYRAKLRSARLNVESDETTGLGNLDYMNRYYAQYINDKNRILYRAFYFYVDTERMSRISSASESDEFLRYCALVLQEYARDTDILAKVSDNGFAMLRLTGDADRLDEWIGTILGRIRAYSKLYSKPFEVNMYVGVYALKPQDRDLSDIIFQASQGAYAAERDETDYVICSSQMMEQLIREKQLQASMDRAFNSREFQIYIQFYVDAQSLKIIGGETLARWNHPQRGVLMPDAFLPMMEREKLVSRLDYYCLREVCDFLEALSEKGVDTFFISTNFSRETFAAADFVAHVKETMDAYSFPRELLIFEITESAAVRNIAQIQQNIAALKEYGVRILLDDFGEGFTSFYDLHRYPVNGIKLDKGLVDQVTTNTGASIVRAMIQVGHELDMTILAEGVESDEQVTMLREAQCDALQGFRFYHPLPQWDARDKILRQFADAGQPSAQDAGQGAAQPGA